MELLNPILSMALARGHHQTPKDHPKNRRNTLQATEHTRATLWYRSFGVYAAWAAREGYSAPKQRHLLDRSRRWVLQVRE